MKSVLNAGFDQMRSSKTKVDVIFWEMKDIERTLKELRYNTPCFSGISRNTQSKLYMLSLTECVWDFQNNALLDTH